MKQPLSIAVLGGDQRQILLAALLQDGGHTVSTGLLERAAPPPDRPALPDGILIPPDCQVVLLPMPVQKNPDILFTPLSDRVCTVSGLLTALPAGTRVLGGAVPAAAHALAAARGLILIDYLQRDALAIRNAVPTAEGAIALAMAHTQEVLLGMPALVIGSGRVGSVLASRLAAFGLHVTVTARTARDRARIQAAGMCAADPQALPTLLPAFPLVFHTVPAPLLTRPALEALPGGALVIDLASGAGGLAPGVTPPAAIRYLHAGSLPGQAAPRTAARAIYDTVCEILTEEGLL